MATTQVIFGRAAALSGTGTLYQNLPGCGGYIWSGTQANRTSVMFVAGTIRNLMIQVNVAPGVGNSWAFTLQKNGSDTSVTLTISGTDTFATDNSNSASFSATDTWVLKAVSSGTPTGSGPVSWVMEFEPTTDDQQIYGGYAADAGTTLNVARYTALLYPYSSDGWSGTAASHIQNIVGVGGTVNGYAIFSQFNAGAGTDWTFAIYKNGTKQDGSGGTVDTRLVFAGSGSPLGAAYSLSTTFSLSVSPSDVVYLEGTLTAGSAPFGIPIRPAITVRFTATTTGAFNIGGGNASLGGAYQTLASFEASVGTETDVRARIGPTGFSLTTIYALVGSAAGGGNSRTFTVRRNATGTSLALTMTGTTGNATATEAFVEGDYASLGYSTTGSPPGTYGSWAFGVNTVVGPGARARTFAWGFA